MDSPHNGVVRSIPPANRHQAPGPPRADGTAVQAAQLLDDKALDNAVDAHGIVRSAVTERSG
jgi:hypothetical protein